MTLRQFRFSWLGLVFVLTACSSGIDGSRYEQTAPALDLNAFFDGHVKAWGIVQNRDGDVVQRFTVDIHGQNKGNELVLNEQFTYGVGDGPKQRTWHITPQSQSQFIGKAGDIAGPAQGQSHGNAFHFNYEMDLPVDDTTYRVHFDDWFWAFDNHALMNRSYIRKFGLVMAEVTIFMQKQP